MSKTNEAQFIPAGNALKLKMGGKFGLDLDAVARAEAALKSLSGQFAEWLNDEITKLDAARAGVRAEGMNVKTAETLYLRAHDLKGLGGTYEYPLVSRIAGSLCRLIDEPSTRATAPLYLIDAHIDAIKAAVRDKIRDTDHPVGKALVTELEGRVNAYLSG